ncbi:MAG: YdcF family protein, partial [Methylovirgula sp.]
EAHGVPASAIVEEGQAHDTIQNIYYSDKIMEANGWHTTEVISSPYHLPRTALILRHYPQLQWKTQAAPWPPDYDAWRKFKLESEEAFGCFRIRIDGFPPSKYLPK